MNSLCVLMFIGFFLTIMSTVTPSTAFVHGIFQMEQSPSVGITRFGPVWTAPSLLSCGTICLNAYTNSCMSFLFNPQTGLCTPGSTLDAAQLLPSPAEGDLYYMVVPSCDVDKGFSVETYNGVRACISISTQTKTYFEASAECQGMGGFLMSAKTTDKLWILHNKNANDSIWVGCDDLVTEGTYVWQEDGESFTSATKPPVFYPGDPNGAEYENCIFRFDNFYLADVNCSVPLKYVCELPIA